MLLFDADVKIATACHQCENCLAVSREFDRPKNNTRVEHLLFALDLRTRSLGSAPERPFTCADLRGTFSHQSSRGSHCSLTFENWTWTSSSRAVYQTPHECTRSRPSRLRSGRKDLNLALSIRFIAGNKERRTFAFQTKEHPFSTIRRISKNVRSFSDVPKLPDW